MGTRDRSDLPAEARRRINREAHRRAQFLAPPDRYRTVFERERGNLAAQYRLLLSAGVPIDEAAELTEHRQAAIVEACRKRLAEAV